MERKVLGSPLSLKLDGEEGAFTATFSTLNVIDKDHDVTLAGAFRDGQVVRIAQWGHNWSALPVGKGVIYSDTERAWVDGQFFLDTTLGKDTYLTVKQLADLQEWSYGFDIKEQSFGEFEGQQVRFLRALDVIEVSPVMIGAGVDTRTDAIKAAPWSTLTDLPYVDALGRVLNDLEEGRWDLSALTGIVTRSADRLEYRQKSGRVLSEANRGMLRELHGHLTQLSTTSSEQAGRLSDLLAATDPEPKAGSPEGFATHGRQVMEEFYRIAADLPISV